MVEGTLIFHIGEFPCEGLGYAFNENETQNALVGRVAERHHSVQDRSRLKSELGLNESGFDETEVDDTLASFVRMEPWRIGETFAACWFEHNRGCMFPWNTERDLRSLTRKSPRHGFDWDCHGRKSGRFRVWRGEDLE